MAYLTEEFNAETVEPAQEYKPIPPGWYVVAISESEMKDTKAFDGQYLQLTLHVLEGEHKGRVLFERLNLVNKNQTAVDIARRTFSAICHAIGVLRVNDTEALHGIPMEAKVKIRPEKGGYPAGNEISAYRPANGVARPAQTQQPAASAAEQPQPAAQQPAPTPANSVTTPW